MSTDGGRRWHDATLVGANDPSCWVAWTLPWTPGRAGAHDLVVRATDSTGRRQPERAPDNDDGYLFSAAVRYRVDVATVRPPALISRPARYAGFGRPGRLVSAFEGERDRGVAHRDLEVLGQVGRGRCPGWSGWWSRAPGSRYPDVCGTTTVS